MIPVLLLLLTLLLPLFFQSWKSLPSPWKLIAFIQRILWSPTVNFIFSLDSLQEVDRLKRLTFIDWGDDLLSWRIVRTVSSNVDAKVRENQGKVFDLKKSMNTYYDLFASLLAVLVSQCHSISFLLTSTWLLSSFTHKACVIIISLSCQWTSFRCDLCVSSHSFPWLQKR